MTEPGSKAVHSAMVKNREPTAETKFARRLRRRQTLAEAQVWAIVRRKQFFGLKFHRQPPIAGFVVDFCCPTLKLVIELEGEIPRWGKGVRRHYTNVARHIIVSYWTL